MTPLEFAAKVEPHLKSHGILIYGFGIEKEATIVMKAVSGDRQYVYRVPMAKVSAVAFPGVLAMSTANQIIEKFNTASEAL